MLCRFELISKLALASQDGYRLFEIVTCYFNRPWRKLYLLFFAKEDILGDKTKKVFSERERGNVAEGQGFLK